MDPSSLLTAAALLASRLLAQFVATPVNTVVGYTVLIAGFLGLYILPAVIAFERGHPRRVRISLTNLFLGWTVVGWVAALVWARKEVKL